MSSFWIYIIGFAIVILGLVMAAVQIGVAAVWIGIGTVVLAGIGILSAVGSTKRKDPPAA
jgi:hypothetical protein